MVIEKQNPNTFTTELSFFLTQINIFIYGKYIALVIKFSGLIYSWVLLWNLYIT